MRCQHQPTTDRVIAGQLGARATDVIHAVLHASANCRVPFHFAITDRRSPADSRSKSNLECQTCANVVSGSLERLAYKSCPCSCSDVSSALMIAIVLLHPQRLIVQVIRRRYVQCALRHSSVRLASMIQVCAWSSTFDATSRSSLPSFVDSFQISPFLYKRHRLTLWRDADHSLFKPGN